MAIIAPHPYVLSDFQIHSPGYGISVTLNHPVSRDTLHVHNVYLPPDDRVFVANQVCDALAAQSTAPGLHFMRGDFNTQVGAPRSETEGEVTATLDAALARLQIHWTTESTWPHATAATARSWTVLRRHTS